MADDVNELLIGNYATEIVEKTFGDRLNLIGCTLAAAYGWHQPTVRFSLDRDAGETAVAHKKIGP